MSIQRDAFETFKKRLQGTEVTVEDTPFIEMFNGMGDDKINRRILARYFTFDEGEGILLIYSRDIKETAVYSKYNEGREESVNSIFNTYYQVTNTGDNWEYSIDVDNVEFGKFYQSLEKHPIKECLYKDLGL